MSWSPLSLPSSAESEDEVLNGPVCGSQMTMTLRKCIRTGDKPSLSSVSNEIAMAVNGKRIQRAMVCLPYLLVGIPFCLERNAGHTRRIGRYQRRPTMSGPARTSSTLLRALISSALDLVLQWIPNNILVAWCLLSLVLFKAELSVW